LEWLIADMGILGAAAINVPPHAPLTARQVQFQFADAAVRWAFVSNAEQLAKVEQVRADLPQLKGIVVFDAAAVPTRVGTAPALIPWIAFVHQGRQILGRLAGELNRRQQAVGPDDLATIMYTSGTTGNPKGVMLTHGNLISNALAALEVAP